MHLLTIVLLPQSGSITASPTPTTRSPGAHPAVIVIVMQRIYAGHGGSHVPLRTPGGLQTGILIQGPSTGYIRLRRVLEKITYASVTS